eukprot:jgi/Mesen1/10980/ME000096S10555
MQQLARSPSPAFVQVASSLLRRAESDPVGDQEESQACGLAGNQQDKCQLANSEVAPCKGPTERLAGMGLEELAEYFTMPISAAARKLGVGLTVLKKKSRVIGIPRWPHRKLKSLESLIHNVQDLAKGSEGKVSAPVLSAVEELKKQRNSMATCPALALTNRTKRLRQASFKISYKRRRQATAQGPSMSGSQPPPGKGGEEKGEEETVDRGVCGGAREGNGAQLNHALLQEVRQVALAGTPDGGEPRAGGCTPQLELLDSHLATTDGGDVHFK